MKKLLIATKNPGKLQELTGFLHGLPLNTVSLAEEGIEDDVEEEFFTYEENAKKKAVYYAKKSGLPSLADDGGIEISALDDAPGVRSKRWIGENASEEELIAHMRSIAASLPEENRDARFVNVVAFALPSGEVWTSRGEIQGVIAREPFVAKSDGLPYRLFFFLPSLGRYYHDESLSVDQMRQLNHRRQSVLLITPLLKEKLLL
ncbi:MAG: hypothetical protein RLZZ455_496 [Candidatus Parcubacteria bacterium]|jgi:XTP/dITP diphosphohydrolase